MKTLGNEIRRMDVPFSLKSAQAESGQHAGSFEGYAAGINNLDHAGDIILPGAFKNDLQRFLKEGVVCWQHDWATPIGKTLEAREDDYGLFVKCRISKTSQGLDAMTLIRDGVVSKMSIGYKVQDYAVVDRAGLLMYLSSQRLPSAKQAAIIRDYDEMGLSEVYLLKKIKLYELSPVTVPANPNASITAAKRLPVAKGGRNVFIEFQRIQARRLGIDV